MMTRLFKTASEGETRIRLFSIEFKTWMSLAHEGIRLFAPFM